MPLTANLYFDKMDLEKYCTESSCDLCKVDSLDEFAKKLGDGEIKGGSCPHWGPARIEAFKLALSADKSFPEVPVLDMPRPVDAGMLEMNSPGPEAPILITGNSEFTQTVMLALLATATSPLRLLTVDVLGHTVDMAMIFKEFTADRILKAIDEFNVPIKTASRIIMPGLTESIKSDVEKALGREVETGPICAAEIPLYMGDDWNTSS